MKILCAALALTVIVAALLADVTADFEGQQPVRPPGFFPRPPGNAGDGCNALYKCGNATCCLRSKNGGSQTCKLLGQHGELCSESGAKGDIFHQHCPCQPGLRCRRFPNGIRICVSGK
uniref:Putative ixodegrin protein n=1 Tax=Ixodes ricinus TaxID=34613 RepID=A0A0K8RJ41_IXORI